MEGKHNKVIVDFPDIQQKIAIEARTWGLAGNHEIISIFPGAEKDPVDSSLIQIFYTSELYYRKKGVDTLIVFTVSSSYKKDFLKKIGNVHLEIHPIHYNHGEINYSRDYKKSGLKRISVYD